MKYFKLVSTCRKQGRWTRTKSILHSERELKMYTNAGKVEVTAESSQLDHLQKTLFSLLETKIWPQFKAEVVFSWSFAPCSVLKITQLRCHYHVLLWHSWRQMCVCFGTAASFASTTFCHSEPGEHLQTNICSLSHIFSHQHHKTQVVTEGILKFSSNNHHSYFFTLYPQYPG